MTITQEYVAECFDYDAKTGDLVWKQRPQHHYRTVSGFRKATTRWAGKVAGSKDHKGYVRINLDGIGYRGHRLVWVLVCGSVPQGELDHINGVRSDNRIENLRVVKRWENARNKKTPQHNTSGYIGVGWRNDLGRWSATIGVGGGKNATLGFFDTKEEAIAARIGAEKVLEYHPNHGR